jgi:hypothetical protein
LTYLRDFIYGHPGGISGGDECPGRGARDVIYGNIVFFEDAQDPYVRVAASHTAGERQPDARPLILMSVIS